MRKQVIAALQDHGYPVGERSQIGKDMHFLRRKRLLAEQIIRQFWLLLMRGAMLALGALLLLGLKEYIGQ